LETVVGLKAVDGAPTSDAPVQSGRRKTRAHGKPPVDGLVLRLQGEKWVVEVDEFGLAATVVDMVKSLRFATQKELADALKVDESTVSRALHKAVALGLANDIDLKLRLKKARELRDNPATTFDDDEADAMPDADALCI
jgi:hypothetical protein